MVHLVFKTLQVICLSFFTMANHHAIGGTYVFIFSNQLLPKGDNSAEDLESWEDLNLSEINLRQVCPDCCSGKKTCFGVITMKPTIFWGNVVVYLLGGGFKYFSFSPLFGEDEPILTNIFQRGWNHQQVFFNHQFSMAPPEIAVPCWSGYKKTAVCPCFWGLRLTSHHNRDTLPKDVGKKVT